MDIQTLLEWTDKQVLEKTGKHLDSLQESILQGIWEHQDYEVSNSHFENKRR